MTGFLIGSGLWTREAEPSFEEDRDEEIEMSIVVAKRMKPFLR